MILMDFSYFFLLFSGFLGGVWGAVLWISAVSATFFRIFWRVWGAVWGISAVSAPQDPLAMLPTYGYCTL